MKKHEKQKKRKLHDPKLSLDGIALVPIYDLSLIYYNFKLQVL